MARRGLCRANGAAAAAAAALLALLLCGPAAAVPAGSDRRAPAMIDRAWEEYRWASLLPHTGAKPSGLAGVTDPICACTSFAYTSAPCQAAVKDHCGKGGAAASSALCAALNKDGGARGVAADAAAGAAVASYLKERCFPTDALEAEPDYCQCFTDPWGKTCILARLAVCASGRSKNLCPALMAGIDAASPMQVLKAKETSNWFCMAHIKAVRKSQGRKATDPDVEDAAPAVCACATKGYNAPECGAAARELCDERVALPGPNGGGGDSDLNMAAFCAGATEPAAFRANASALAPAATFLARHCYGDEAAVASATMCSCFQSPNSKACGIARLRTCLRAGDVACPAMMLGDAAPPASAAYYAAAKEIGSPACKPTALMVSMVFDGIGVDAYAKSFGNATANAIAALTKPAAAAANARPTNVSWAAAPIASSAAASAAGARGSAAGRRLLAQPQPVLAVFAVEASDRAAAQQAISKSLADSAQALYAAVRVAGVPFKPRAVAIDGQPPSGAGPVGVMLPAWSASRNATAAAAMDPYAAPAGADGAANAEPARRAPLSHQAVIAIVAGTVVGVLAALAVTCVACVALQRRRNAAWAREPAPGRRPRCSDSAIKLPSSDISEEAEGEAEKFGETMRAKYARLQKAKQAAAAAPSFAGSSPRYGAPSTGGASFHYDYSGDASGSGSGGNSPRGRH